MLLFILTSLWFNITDEEPLEAIDYFDYIFWSLALAGVFGYSFSKNILNNNFWKLFLPFIVVWDFYIIDYVIIRDPEILSEEYGVGFIIFTAIFYFLFKFPEYIGIYL